MNRRASISLRFAAPLALALTGAAWTGCQQTATTPPPAPTPPATPAPAPPTVVVAAPTVDAAPPVAPLVAGPADPRDAQLSAYVREVTDAMVHAVRGERVDPRFVSAHPVHTVSALSPEDRQRMTAFGTMTVLGTEVELDAIARPTPGDHFQVMAHAFVLPDGRVHWGSSSGRRDADENVHPTPGVDRDAPALNASVQRVIDALRGPCALPWATDADLPTVPPALRGELIPNPAAVRAACTLVAGVHGEWRTHFDDVRVFVQGNGSLGVLRGTFNVEGSDTPGHEHLVLAPVHIQVLTGGD